MSTVRVERDGGVLRVTMCRPERRNAFDAELIADLTDAFADVGDSRCVVLAGDGKSFSAGADADWMRASVGLSFEENVADAERLRAMCEAIDGCPAPVIARVQGHAMGGGLGLVACCDVAVSAPDTVYSLSEARLGLVPAVISPFVIEKIGTSAARRLFVTSERFDAALALRIGLVHEVADELDAAVDGVVANVLAGGPLAVREAKRIARERPQGRATAEWIARLRASEEGQEGLRAFAEKRRPAWQGGPAA